jgi:hypothetical protein
MKCGVIVSLLAKETARLYFTGLQITDFRTFYDLQITEVQMAVP